MILPIITAFPATPLTGAHGPLRQGAYGVGSTRWHFAIFNVILPAAISAIIGGVFMLALGPWHGGNRLAVTYDHRQLHGFPKLVIVGTGATRSSAMLANHFWRIQRHFQVFQPFSMAALILDAASPYGELFWRVDVKKLSLTLLVVQTFSSELIISIWF